MMTHRRLGDKRVYLPLCKVADTPFQVLGDDIDDGCVTHGWYFIVLSVVGFLSIISINRDELGWFDKLITHMWSSWKIIV